MSTKLDRLLTEKVTLEEQLRFRVNGRVITELVGGKLDAACLVEKDDLPAYLEWLTDLLTEEKTEEDNRSWGYNYSDPVESKPLHRIEIKPREGRARPAPLPFSIGETAHDRHRRWTYNDHIK